MNQKLVSPAPENIQKGQKGRSVGLDVLKAVAIMLVVFQHNYYVPFDILAQPTISSYGDYFIRSFMSLHVTTFFMVNGALLFSSPLNLKKHIIKTIKLIVTMYLWAFLTLMISPLLRGAVPPSLSAAAMHILKWDSTSLTHFWFLRKLVAIYIVFPVVKVLWDRFRPGYLILFAALVLIIFGNSGLTMLVNTRNILQGRDGYYGWFNYFGFLNPLRTLTGVSLTYFMLGGVLWELRRQLDRKWVRIAAAILLPLACIVLCCYGCMVSNSVGKQWDIIYEGYSSVCALCGVILLFVLSLGFHKDRPGRFVRGLQLIGKNTLGVYYLHVIFGGALAQVYQSIPYFDTLPVNLIYVVLLVLISLGVTILLKKIPYVRTIME